MATTTATPKGRRRTRFSVVLEHADRAVGEHDQGPPVIVSLGWPAKQSGDYKPLACLVCRYAAPVMANPDFRNLTARERQLGRFAFVLLLDWADWVHRRVETIMFFDPFVRSHRISVDFTCPLGLGPTPDPGEPKAPDPGKRLVPLALMRKRNLRRFSLRDELGGALPLLTWRQTAPIAAGVLHAAANYTPFEATEPWVSSGLTKAAKGWLWSIVHEEPPEALAAFDTLQRAKIAHDDFLHLALDLARNFLVLVPLSVSLGERRVLKLSYDEQEDPHYKAGQRRSRVPATRIWKSPSRDVAPLTIHAFIVDRSEGDAEWAPASGMPVEVRSLENDLCKRLQTNAAGSARCDVLLGEYQLEELPPTGVSTLGRPLLRRVTVEPEERMCQICYYERVSPPREPIRRERSLRILQWLGWRAYTTLIAVPAAGQCAGYHLEVESPEALTLTGTRLIEEPKSGLPAGGTFEGQYAEERMAVARSHLYVSGVRQSSSALATCRLRPRPSVLAKPATVGGVFTSALLLETAMHAGKIGNNLGTVATLLLFLPGAIAALIARPRENPLETRNLASLRMLTVAGAGVSVIGAVVLTLNHDWFINASHQLSLRTTWPGTGTALWICFAFELLFTVLLGTAWWAAAHPREIRPRHELK